MSLVEFKKSPWLHSHRCYQRSALSITPAPEYSSSEVLLASLYRIIGYSSLSESSVPQAGRDLEKSIQKLQAKRNTKNNEKKPHGAIVDVEAWNTVLHGILESPKLPNQSSKRFFQVTPIVPGTAIFSGSARLAGNPWTPGRLIRRMVCLGSEDKATAQTLWKNLYTALSVNNDDDIFARWLDRETSAWHSEMHWDFCPIPDEEFAILETSDFQGVGFLPARRFTKDLRAIIQAKGSMTRRQWTSLLEAILRLAAASHVTWLCDIQARIWKCLRSALTNGTSPTNEEAAREAIFPQAPQYMVYGGKALPALRDHASSYLNARLGINTLLWSLDQIDAPYTDNLSSSADIASLCRHILRHKAQLENLGIMETIVDVREQEARALLCKKGIGSNLLEFGRHVLGQRQTAAALLRGYDQGYILQKKGNSPSSPWIVSLGPVAVLALVHCSLSGMGGPRSVHRLGEHLESYGITVDKHDIAKNDLGLQLRMLGLVLDSPDAESGMLLLPPFPVQPADTEL